MINDIIETTTTSKGLLISSPFRSIDKSLLQKVTLNHLGQKGHVSNLLIKNNDFC